MLSEQAQRAQQPTPTKISAGEALALAYERFPNLTAAGSLGAKQSGQPIEPAHVEIAIKFLSGCRRTKKPAVHSHDLRRAIGKGVSQGAVIAAAIALGFDARSWMGTQMFVPGAMINVVLP
jgi:hypothetical protein